MLSRVANSLFWLARYVERAENSARFLGVTEAYAHELAGISRPAADACWTAAWDLIAPGQAPGDDPGNLSQLLFDLDLNTSLLSSISLARENARSIRDATPSEL